MVESLNVRNDSLISNPQMASSATLRLAGELGAQLQSLLLNLNFSFSKVAIEEYDDVSVQVEEYDSEFFDQEGHLNPWTKFLLESEYEEYCMAHDIALPYPKHEAPFQDFLFKKKLTPPEKDPEDYPGIQHAAQLLSRDIEAENGDTLSLLDEERQYMLMNVLNSKYSAELAKDKFRVGESVPSEFKGGRWTILTRLNNASGSFKCGVYLVKHGMCWKAH